MVNEQYMQFALNLAKKAEGQTNPNPLVGAVIVKENEVLGYGSHLRAGGKHAEIHALEMAGEAAEGATLYVTLEPCSHKGKTPPCTTAIIRSGIKRVVVASLDPNQKVKGIEMLQRSGVQVSTGVLESKAISMNRPFFHYIKNNIPYITLKTAMSLDGKIATETGESQWITGEKSRADVHVYRASHDAILVGVGTVLADNPRLTARTDGGAYKQPIRIILDTHLRTPITSHIIQKDDAKTWIFVGKDAPADKIRLCHMYSHVTIIQLDEEKLRVKSILQILGERKIMSLFIEGGASVSSSFLTEANPNQLVLYIAPMIIGGKNAPSPFSGAGLQKLSEAQGVTIEKTERLDNDLKIVGYFKGEE